MAERVVRFLVQRPGGMFLDATVGAGGHGRALLEAAGPSARLIAVDRDPAALVVAAASLGAYGARVTFHHGSFAALGAALDAVEGPLDGALFDLGVSSMQLDTAARGFSFQGDAPLDMRMDPAGPVTAADLVNRGSESELADTIERYGQERWARRIARRIVQRRPIRTTAELVSCVMQALPRGRGWQRIHPATRTFQALRIAVNQELDALEAAIPRVLPRLAPGGRIAVLSYHSLEDRIVKHAFQRAAADGTLEILTRRPLQPEDAEIQANPRARSARLRVGARRA